MPNLPSEDAFGWWAGVIGIAGTGLGAAWGMAKWVIRADRAIGEAEKPKSMMELLLDIREENRRSHQHTTETMSYMTRKVDDLDGRVGELATDVAYIKGRMKIEP